MTIPMVVPVWFPSMLDSEECRSCFGGCCSVTMTVSSIEWMADVFVGHHSRAYWPMTSDLMRTCSNYRRSTTMNSNCSALCSSGTRGWWAAECHMHHPDGCSVAEFDSTNGANRNSFAPGSLAYRMSRRRTLLSNFDMDYCCDLVSLARDRTDRRHHIWKVLQPAREETKRINTYSFSNWLKNNEKN